MPKERRIPAPLDGLSRLDATVCGSFRERLAAVGFTARLVAEADAFLPGVLRGPRLPIVRWWLEQRAEPGAALARLFLYDDRLTEGEAGAALGAELFAALVASGILTRTTAGTIEALFLIYPWMDGLLVLADRLGTGADAVMGPAGGTDHLAGLLPASPGPRVLDLGCGAGSFALLAARRGAAVAVGVDVNPRAIELAAFNARLNTVNARFLVGDGTAPVAGEAFDLVVSQPPFVARPPGQDPQTFLFGGARGDELPLRFATEASRMLAPRGRALLLVQAPEPFGLGGETLMDGVLRALGETRPHVLGLSFKGPSLATQASVFASFEDPELGEGYAAAARRYLEHFRALGLRGVTGALLVLTRPAAESDGGRRYALSLAVASAFYNAATLDHFLRGMDLAEGPVDLLERASLRLSPHARISQEPAADPGPPGGRARIRIAPPAIGMEMLGDPEELRVLAAIDEAVSVGAALDALAGSAGPGAERERLLAFVRNALVQGTLGVS